MSTSTFQSLAFIFGQWRFCVPYRPAVRVTPYEMEFHLTAQSLTRVIVKFAAAIATVVWGHRPDHTPPGVVPVALFATKRKRGNPNWGRPVPPLLALPTEFEMRVRQLQLTAGMYASSRELRAWCERNRNRCYVPEWLLGEWGMTVDLNFGAVA
jgi:hypothetical protein